MKDAKSSHSQEFRVGRNESHKNGLAAKYGFKMWASKVEFCASFENNFFRIARALEREKTYCSLAVYVRKKSQHFGVTSFKGA